jgi:hypothetical protein
LETSDITRDGLDVVFPSTETPCRQWPHLHVLIATVADCFKCAVVATAFCSTSMPGVRVVNVSGNSGC